MIEHWPEGQFGEVEQMVEQGLLVGGEAVAKGELFGEAVQDLLVEAAEELLEESVEEPVEEATEDMLEEEEKGAVEEAVAGQPEEQLEGEVEAAIEVAVEEVVEKNLAALSSPWEIHLRAPCSDGYYLASQYHPPLPPTVPQSLSGSFPTPSQLPLHQSTTPQPPFRHLPL